MEMLQIVDKYGNFTGEIMSREEAHDKNLLHNEVATFIINSKNQMLLEKRSITKRFNPGKWGLCSGHVGAYESLEEAALREIKEEVGLDIDKTNLKQIGDKMFILGSTNSHIT